MLVSAPKLDNPLDCAVGQLRDISDDRELLKSSIDAGTVRRMLVHISNINVSVLASTRDHLNATKRLKDFAFTLIRMAKSAEFPNEVLTTRMARVARHLRAASDELARSDAIPNWQTSVSLRAMIPPRQEQQIQLQTWEGEGGAQAPRAPHP
jgi:hypothetical protein